MIHQRLGIPSGLWLILLGSLLSVQASFAMTPGADTTPTYRQLMEYVDNIYRANSSHGQLTMTIEKSRGTRTLDMELWTRGEEHALVVIRAPAREAGTATLRTPEGLWNYAPRADRLIRIPEGLLSENWMGSHFTNDDLMRETNYDEDYTGSVARVREDGDTLLRVEMLPRPDAPVVYSKIVFHVTPEQWVPVREEFYDDGTVIRTMTFSDVEVVDDRPIPMVMELHPADKPSEWTRLEYRQLEFGVEIDDGMFTRRGLRRIARP